MFQFPASIEVVCDPASRELFEIYWATREGIAQDMMASYGAPEKYRTAATG